MLAEELQFGWPWWARRGVFYQEQIVGTDAERTCTGRRNLGRLDSHRLPSNATPPPGTIMWICGWWVMVEPQGVQHGGDTDRGRRDCLGSAAIVSTVSAEALNSRS